MLGGSRDFWKIGAWSSLLQNKYIFEVKPFWCMASVQFPLFSICNWFTLFYLYNPFSKKNRDTVWNVQHCAWDFLLCFPGRTFFCILRRSSPGFLHNSIKKQKEQNPWSIHLPWIGLFRAWISTSPKQCEIILIKNGSKEQPTSKEGLCDVP